MSSGVTVDFNANIARFTGAIDKATNDLNKFQSNADRISQNIKNSFAALGAGLSIGAAGAYVKSVIDMADEMNDLSQRIGINIKELTGWQLAAKQSGTSIEAVAKGVKGLSGFMLENADRLKKAGITATDANGALIQLADVFKALPDGIEKTTLAVDLFGKSGLEMVPMLNLGSAGLKEAHDKAKAYGERLAELAPHADKFNDELAELALQAQAASINLTGLAVGPMATWLEMNNEAIKVAGGATEALRLFVFNLDAMTTEKPAEEIKRLSQALKDYQEASALGKFEQSPTGFLFGGREEDLQKQITFLKSLQRLEASTGAAALGDIRDARDRMLSDISTMNVAKAQAAAAALRTGSRAGKTGKSDLQKMLDLAADRQAGMVDSGEGGLSVATVSAQYAAKAAAENTKRLNDLLAQTPTGQIEKAREEMQFLAAALEAGTIKEWQFTEAVGVHYGQAADAMNEMGQFAIEAARNIQDAMADGFFDLMQGRFDNLGDQFKATLDRMVANAVAADLSNRMFGDFSKTGEIGGGVGELAKLALSAVSSFFGGIPAFAEGTPYVPRTGLALIHQGERIVPAEQNKAGFGGTINITINGSNNAPDVRRAAGQGAREALAAFAGAQRYN